jgi:steroid 5-alpha reductase family enzyme
MLIAGAFGIWTLRLAGHLLGTRCRPGMADDGRYQRLHQAWGNRAGRNMFWMFQAQALLALLLATAWLPALRADSAELPPFTLAVAALLLLSLSGGAVADAQLARFRRSHPAGGICRLGLWRYSRHPNYFFEIVSWWLLAVLAVPVSFVPLAAAAVMTWLITCVTGIPPKERQALLSRGDAYRAYMAETRRLLPLPRSFHL